MESFTQDVVKIISTIPPGKVMTYGQIARLAGSPRGARQVARILHSMSQKYKLPWHRVVNAQGKIVISDEAGSEVQRLSLESEDVPVTEAGRVDLERYQYHPEV
ncbi:MGMT family protein [Thalassobacillus devorans]|uniref:MGMT family protein n=1 Tax=Thalassobacillus devorans TaxID=279813 RepID=UPI000A1CDA20|nr:MGMT family protein [Thalassobacillus devorans]